KAARNWQCFDEIVAALKALGDDETLLIQSGKPVGVFPTHADAPRVLLANSNLVARWADWDHFNELDRKGLMMFGQMTAGSWIYIGSQGIVQGTYETFVEMGRQHYGGRLAGKWILTAGLGGMGGAQPLAATMAGASMLAVECRPERIAKRLKTRYLDVEARTLDEALEILERARRAAKPVSVGLLGNACEVLPELLRRGVRPDALTDQTSAHDPVNGYLPGGWTLEKWDRLRGEDPAQVAREARASMRAHVEAMLEFQKQKVPVFDYGNNIRQVALDEGLKEAFAFPGFVPAYVRPLFGRGELKAPIVIGRDHLDSGSVASPNRETEAMKDGSDAVADWPLLNALLNTASGATWVSIHHGGGVGMGYSQHAGVVIVCDGTAAAARRIERVLWNDPASGVMRHADAGYESAIECARARGLNLPFLRG